MCGGVEGVLVQLEGGQPGGRDPGQGVAGAGPGAGAEAGGGGRAQTLPGLVVAARVHPQRQQPRLGGLLLVTDVLVSCNTITLHHDQRTIHRENIMSHRRHLLCAK